MCNDGCLNSDRQDGHEHLEAVRATANTTSSSFQSLGGPTTAASNTSGRLQSVSRVSVMSQNDDLEALFTLRAEDLTEADLERLTAEVPGDESILRRLMGPGPKLLKGPRGSGKSNYLKRAYFKLQSRDNVMVAYINYSQHLALEPLMLRSERALEHFRQWLVYKIIMALDESLGADTPDDLRVLADAGRKFVNELQTSVGRTPEFVPTAIAPSQLLDMIEAWCEDTGRSRAVLLMDDAAHAFMQQQQREFFEVFRALRSRTVACKAAIYPGVTSYSPFFNVGHEAEEIEVWTRTDSADYLGAMRAIFVARFPKSLQSAVRPELIDVAAYASFGLPRNFLNILSDSLGDADDEDDDDDIALKLTAPTLPKVRAAIKANSGRVRSLFEEVSRKLPRYENFIQVGIEAQDSMLAEIRQTNRNRRGVKQPRYIGTAIALPWDADLTQVISAYGICRSRATNRNRFPRDRSLRASADPHVPPHCGKCPRTAADALDGRLPPSPPQTKHK
jgi:hypothetical protein